MAEEKQDKFSPLDDAVKKQAAEIFDLIFGKYINSIAVKIAGNDGPVATIDNNGFFNFKTSPSGKISDIQDQVNLLIKAIPLWNMFYKGVIDKEKSGRWKKFKVLEKPVKEQDWNYSKIFDFLNEAKFTDEKGGEVDSANTLESWKNGLETIANISQVQASKKDIENFGKTIKEIGDKAKSLSFPLFNNKLKIANFDEIKDKIPDGIQTDFDGKGEEDQGEEAPKEVQQAVSAAANATIHSNDHIDDKNFDDIYEKTSESVNKAFDVAVKWAESNETVNAMYDKLNKGLGELSNTLIGQMWIINTLINIKDLLGEALHRKMLLNMITEDDENSEVKSDTSNDNEETADKNDADKDSKDEDTEKKKEQIEIIKKIIMAVDDVLKNKKPAEFKSAYEKWVAEVKKIVDAIAKSDTYKDKVGDITKSKDPYQQICLCYKLLSAEENKEDNAQGGEDSQGNSESDTAGSKPDTEKDGAEGFSENGGAQESITKLSLHDYLMKALNG